MLIHVDHQMLRSLANETIVFHYLIKEEYMYVHLCVHGKLVQEVQKAIIMFSKHLDEWKIRM